MQNLKDKIVSTLNTTNIATSFQNSSYLNSLKQGVGLISPSNSSLLHFKQNTSTDSNTMLNDLNHEDDLLINIINDDKQNTNSNVNDLSPSSCCSSSKASRKKDINHHHIEKENVYNNSKKPNLNSNNSGILVDIGLFSDLTTNKIVKRNNNKYEIFDDQEDVPMLNPNFNPSEEISDSNGVNITVEDEDEINRQRNNLKSDSKLSDHCHVGNKDLDQLKKRNKPVLRKLISVLILCILFMIAEIIGGLLANSISIQTDAAHMAADIVGFFLSIVAIYIAQKKPTKRLSYGYYRSEVLGALFSTLIIWILTGVLVYLAILRIIKKEYEIQGDAMIITASLGVVFNIVMYFILHTNKCFNGIELSHHGHSHSADGHGHGHGHSHSHGHSHNSENHNHSHDNHNHGHSHSKKYINRTENNMPINDSFEVDNRNCDEPEESDKNDDTSNINIRAAAIHVIGDFIQSLGVLIAAIIIRIKPEFKIADPICTFIFSAMVIFTTAPIIKDIYFVLMEALPVSINYDSVVNDLCEIEHVKRAHNLHIWCLTMDKFALSVHLVTEKDIDTQKVLKDANNLLRTKYKIEKTTIQIEYFKESMVNCQDCKLPE